MKNFLFVVVVLAIWLKFGILVVSKIEDEGYVSFFVKNHVTFKVVFKDPYRSDALGEEDEYKKRMDANGDWLPGTEEFTDFMEYCKYRYGIVGVDTPQARSECKDR